MNMNEFEKRLQNHAKSIKDTIETPFNIETEELIMTNNKHSIKKTVLLAAAIICLIGTTVFAAYHLLSPKEIALEAGYEQLAEVFENDGTKLNIPAQQSGDYTIQILGMASGKNLTGFVGDVDVAQDRHYIVGAISRTDGKALTDYTGIQMSPLVSGYEPWRVNIFTLNGGKTEFLSDDNMIDYFLYECDALEIFADKTVYISFYEGIAPSAEIFKFNTDGSIEFKESYTGVKALFEIPLDKSKADPEKADQIVEDMWADDIESTDDASAGENTDVKEVTINPDFSVTTEEFVLEKEE